MNIEEVRLYCLSKRGAEECFPFDDTTLVFKVGGKIFALLSLDEMRMSLKCDPQKAIELRMQYMYVIPGYHMNKKMWNTILPDDNLPDHLLCEWIDHSYELVVQKLSKLQQQKL
jgi:predicted DNA-binding protein (MmcQ/YjbR family)